MAKITRVIQKIFGVNAGIDERSKIGSLAAGSPVLTTDPVVMQALANYGQGLFGTCIGENSPPLEDLNSLYYLMTRQLAYIFQQGVAEYDATTEYHLGSVVNLDGVFYSSLINTNLGNPLTDITKWKIQGNNVNANLINGKVVPLYPVVASSVFSRNAVLNTATNIYKMKVSFDGKYLMYLDIASGAGLKILDFNPKKINTTSPVTISAQPTGLCSGFAESPDERFLALGSDTTPFVHFYERIGSAFTKLANPSTLPTAGSVSCDSVAWSPDSNLVAFCGNNGMKLMIYRREGKTFTKVADPATMPANFTGSIKFSPDGNFLALVSTTPSVIYIYKISYDATGLPVFTYVANSFTWVTSINKLDWHPDSSCLLVTDVGLRVFTINSTTGVLTEVVQTALPSTATRYIFEAVFSPDGKSAFANSQIAAGTRICFLSFNTVTKQFAILNDVVSSGSTTTASYSPYTHPSNKYLLVHRGDSTSFIEIWENPEVVDIFNKTPRLLYRRGSDQ